MSDTTFAVAKSGRLVLPRAQVERCLPDLLRLGGGAGADDDGKPSPALRMSSDLVSAMESHSMHPNGMN